MPHELPAPDRDLSNKEFISFLRRNPDILRIWNLSLTFDPNKDIADIYPSKATNGARLQTWNIDVAQIFLPYIETLSTHNDLNRKIIEAEKGVADFRFSGLSTKVLNSKNLRSFELEVLKKKVVYWYLLCLAAAIDFVYFYREVEYTSKNIVG